MFKLTLNFIILQELEQKKRDHDDVLAECEFYKLQVTERDKLIQVRSPVIYSMLWSGRSSIIVIILRKYERKNYNN